ncbi:hypothetical protein ACHQM5_012972 [Ranunculus cassubicifolius]
MRFNHYNKQGCCRCGWRINAVAATAIVEAIRDYVDAVGKNNKFINHLVVKGYSEAQVGFVDLVNDRVCQDLEQVNDLNLDLIKEHSSKSDGTTIIGKSQLEVQENLVVTLAGKEKSYVRWWKLFLTATLRIGMMIVIQVKKLERPFLPICRLPLLVVRCLIQLLQRWKLGIMLFPLL